MQRRLTRTLLLVISSVAMLQGTSYAVKTTYPVKVFADSACVNPSCNNADGCSWVSGTWTYWFPHGNCATAFPVGSGSGCTETYRKCRVDDFYSDRPGCWGSVNRTVTYEFGCG